MSRIRNAWAVLTGKATVCTHINQTATLTFNYGPGPNVYISEPTMATPFRNLTIL